MAGYALKKLSRTKPCARTAQINALIETMMKTHTIAISKSYLEEDA